MIIWNLLLNAFGFTGATALIYIGLFATIVLATVQIAKVYFRYILCN